MKYFAGSWYRNTVMLIGCPVKPSAVFRESASYRSGAGMNTAVAPSAFSQSESGPAMLMIFIPLRSSSVRTGRVVMMPVGPTAEPVTNLILFFSSSSCLKAG
jgi:hypothetical protein